MVFELKCIKSFYNEANGVHFVCDKYYNIDYKEIFRTDVFDIVINFMPLQLSLEELTHNFITLTLTEKEMLEYTFIRRVNMLWFPIAVKPTLLYNGYLFNSKYMYGMQKKDDYMTFKQCYRRDYDIDIPYHNEDGSYNTFYDYFDTKQFRCLTHYDYMR